MTVSMSRAGDTGTRRSWSVATDPKEVGAAAEGGAACLCRCRRSSRNEEARRRLSLFLSLFLSLSPSISLLLPAGASFPSTGS